MVKASVSGRISGMGRPNHKMYTQNYTGLCWTVAQLKATMHAMDLEVSFGIQEKAGHIEGIEYIYLIAYQR